MADKVQTKQMGNFNMAAAGDRILAFWEKNANGKIYTDKDQKDGDLKVFVSYIWKDRATWMEALKAMPAGVSKETAEAILLMSADTNAPAKQPDGKEAKKDFEKLDTVSVGRALAKLGFLKDGQVASNEELEDRLEFNDWKKDKLDNEADEAIIHLSQATDITDLQTRWGGIGGSVKQVERVIEKKNELKDAFLKAAETKE